jgi:glutaminyl-tRNA synthetase
MPTIAGMRRRGFTPEAIRNFADKIGVAKANSVVDYELLNFCLRDDLNLRAKRVMVVLDPLEIEIENYPDDKLEYLDAENNPEDTNMGKRQLLFSKRLYIEREDYIDTPPKNWFRFAPGAEVRLKHAYYVTCKETIKNEQGEVIKLICTYDPDSRGGWTNDGRKVKGTSHWVSAQQNTKVEVRLYEHLFHKTDPMSVAEGQDYTANLNPQSLTILSNCIAETSLIDAKIGEKFQFLRQGYFSLDQDSDPLNETNIDRKLIFNKIVSLKDSYKPPTTRKGV